MSSIFCKKLFLSRFFPGERYSRRVISSTSWANSASWSAPSQCRARGDMPCSSAVSLGARDSSGQGQHGAFPLEAVPQGPGKGGAIQGRLRQAVQQNGRVAGDAPAQGGRGQLLPHFGDGDGALPAPGAGCRARRFPWGPGHPGSAAAPPGFVPPGCRAACESPPPAGAGHGSRFAPRTDAFAPWVLNSSSCCIAARSLPWLAGKRGSVFIIA